ncbi:MAG: phage virion morphogenesis protein [Roseateles depolymerans]|uniref:Phage virion morphogenesis protein n=1 Tax=Roseateles depolymerans TaxID=76731 RepID=A0A2W5DI11_9BURK|nr:MAG: phage virion morphogenesis protein [Roseateles depolymerans]
MDDLQQFDEWLAPLLANLAPAKRRAMARDIARELRRSQQRRIAAQQNPDGSAYEPRKPLLRDRKGEIKRRAMFTKIRQASYLKTQASPEEATVGFAGRIARIASVHQFGLRDLVKAGGPEYTYPKRALLGLTSDEKERVRSMILDRLSSP